MIPNVFHFLFGFKPNDPFLLYHYLTIASAIKHNQPDAVHVWIHHEPRGEWWQRAVKLPLVEIHAITPPVAIFGNPLLHYAHQADIVRLQVIEKYGGIYLDIDTIVYKDMSPLRLNSQCVMGWQSNDVLCNAVIMSEPHGQFVSRWLEEGRYFRGRGLARYWDEYAVRIGAKLILIPELKPSVSVMPHNAFFYPPWTNIDPLITSSDEIPFADSYSSHLWESGPVAHRKLSVITPEWIASNSSIYAKRARTLL